MKKAKKAIFVGVVLATAAMLLQVGAAAITSSPETNEKIRCKVSAINEPIPTLSNQGNVLISADNPDNDDLRPKITKKAGTLVVAYEKVVDILKTTIPVCYSDDAGESWTMQFDYDSSEFPSGSGALQSPDIKYCPDADEFFLTMIDPLAEMYNQEFSWIPSDIAGATSAPWWGVSGVGSEDYTEAALTYVGKWCVGLAIESGGGTEHYPSLAYVWYDEDTDDVYFPNRVDPSWISGFYYDGQSILKTAPAYHPEMATGANRMYMVMQTDTDTGSKISFKATVTDLDLLLGTKGGGPGEMDKYADIEVWPWQMYVTEDATDPDVSASGDNLCIVYMQDGKVKCSYTSEVPDEGEEYEFDVSVVDDNGAYPSVYMSGSHVYCAYAKDGNVYRAESEDGGATWGTPEQINDVDGTVAGESGSVDIIDLGVVWTDTRNGPKDIYFGGGVARPIISIKSISGVIGVSAVVANIGTADATNVDWTITIDAPIMIIGRETTGTIATLAAGSEETIKSGLVLGFGPCTITVTATGATPATAKGWVIGPFVLGVK